MIDQFGQVMLYVKDPQKSAQFWVEKAGFVALGEGDGTAPDERGIAWAEVAPTEASDTSLVLFEREKIAAMEPEVNLGTPSILFSSYNLKGAYDDCRRRGVATTELTRMGGIDTFAFSDDEGHWFAMREVPRPQ